MKTSFLPILFTVLLSLFHFNSNSQIINVPADYSSIQSALDNANEGDTVLVQPGTYYENIIWPLTQGIKLFSNGDSTNTVIDGNNQSRVILFYPNFHYDSTTIIRGFKITKGKGGIYLSYANIILEKLNISNNISNSYGGGISCNQSNPIIRNVQIKYNSVIPTSFALGGGIYCTGSSPNISNTEILYNHLETGASYYYGSGFYGGYNSDPVFSNVNISNNTSGSDGTYYHGTGVHLSKNSNPTFNNVIISNNTSGNGGNYYYGNGVYISRESNSQFNNVNITNNTSGNGGSYYKGGGIYIDRDSDAIFTNVSINSNSTGSGSFINEGGGVYINDCNSIILKNSVIADNKIGSTQINRNCYGGGIRSNSDNLELINVTIVNNNRALGLPIFGSGVSAYSASLTNCISINDNSESEIGGNVNINYSNIRGGYQGEGNIDEDPLFVSPTDYHLQEESPCLATGTMDNILTYDIEGNPRPSPVGSNPDMGAYEMDYGSPPPPTDVPISNSAIVLSFALVGIAILLRKLIIIK